jgi:hypothetical protein
MYFRRMFQVFHLSFLYVASVASKYFKSRSGVTHRIHGKLEGTRAVAVGDVRQHGPPRGCETKAQTSNVRPMQAHAWTREMDYSRRCPDVGVRPDCLCIVAQSRRSCKMWLLLFSVHFLPRNPKQLPPIMLHGVATVPTRGVGARRSRAKEALNLQYLSVPLHLLVLHLHAYSS